MKVGLIVPSEKVPIQKGGLGTEVDQREVCASVHI